MALIAGTGGSITIDATPDVTLHVANWSIDAGNRLADGTTSAKTSSHFEGTLGDNSWQIELPVDAAGTPEDAGITPGTQVSIFFRVGSTNTYHKLVTTTVERVGITNPNTGDLHRNAISGRGGAMTWYGAGPS